MASDTFGAWNLENELGRGPFGVRWRAVRPGREPVVLEILDPVPDAAYREHVMTGSDALVNLEHPGLVPFLGVFEDGDRVAFMWDVFEGLDLRARSRLGRIPPAQAAAALESLLGALDALHADGRAHGHVSPDDVFFGADGTVRLGGAVPALPPGFADEGETTAPEAFEGPATPASDVYSAGLIAWQMLVGQAACPAGPPSARAKWHRTVGASDVRKAGAACPPWLAEAVGAMTRIDPARRPQNARAALNDLAERRREAAELEADDDAPTARVRPGGREEAPAGDKREMWKPPPAPATWKDLPPEREVTGSHKLADVQAAIASQGQEGRDAPVLTIPPATPVPAPARPASGPPTAALVGGGVAAVVVVVAVLWATGVLG